MGRELIIPIYIDTNALLDLLASIEDGFSTVQKVTSNNAKSNTGSIEASVGGATEFGIPNVLSLLKLNLGFSGKKENASESSEQREMERYHTYGSLFHRLRSYLDQHQLIKRLSSNTDSWTDVRPSDFVEVHGLFRANPLANTLETIDKMATLAELAATLNEPKQTNQPAQRQTQLKQQKRSPESTTSNIPGLDEIRKFIRATLKDIQTETTQLFVVDLDDYPAAKVVAVLFRDYIRGKTLAEINNKEYFLIGKVARKIEQGASEIDLLQGTGLGGMPESSLAQLVGAFSAIPGFNLPKAEIRVPGPALEIVPVAVFV